jgi:hypothetical protein
MKPLPPLENQMIYSWIWQKLPGKKFLKTLVALAIATIIVAGLFLWAFPAIESAFIESPVIAP